MANNHFWLGKFIGIIIAMVPLYWADFITGPDGKPLLRRSAKIPVPRNSYTHHTHVTRSIMWRSVPGRLLMVYNLIKQQQVVHSLPMKQKHRHWLYTNLLHANTGTAGLRKTYDLLVFQPDRSHWWCTGNGLTFPVKSNIPTHCQCKALITTGTAGQIFIYVKIVIPVTHKMIQLFRDEVASLR